MQAQTASQYLMAWQSLADLHRKSYHGLQRLVVKNHTSPAIQQQDADGHLVEQIQIIELYCGKFHKNSTR
jgi:hypothetical protein